MINFVVTYQDYTGNKHLREVVAVNATQAEEMVEKSNCEYYGWGNTQVIKVEELG